LSRLVRDLLVLSVDAGRVSDPEIAGEGERERLVELSRRFSKEDLLRAFDLLTKAEADIRSAAQPRYHLEMAFLRWIHLRKLVAIEDLIQSAGSAPLAPAASGGPARSAAPAPTPRGATRAIASPAGPGMAAKPAGGAASGVRPMSATAEASAPASTAPIPPAASGVLKDSFLAEVRQSNPVLYGTLVVQAQQIDVSADRIVLTFAADRKIDSTFDKYRPLLEATASKLAGRKMTVIAQMGSAREDGGAAAPVAPAGGAESGRASAADRKSSLKEQALADASVRALLEVFPAEIRDVEEL
jgi:DNA polymerase III gamma/tau subunit